jgi:DNA mismatch repair protein MutL
MNKIIILEKNTRDQIAAGEVAERPVFIIKELVENAIDAGATDIRIHLKESGISEIRVIDNGEGIEKDDIPYAFLRHATSKIKTINDLNSLKTMGFRGEALASIAAVAKTIIRTRTAKEESGYECRIEGGEIGEVTTTAANTGTELRIKDLFFNTPARKKFLATPVREVRDISDMVGRIIIAYPAIRFELTNNGKRIFFSPGNDDMKAAIAGVYGREPLKFLLPIENNAVFSGYIAHPNYSKPNRNYYHFYINHRTIQSNELNKALENAFRTLLPERRFPLAFINITLPPDQYDINVHPNKLEVKFAEGSGIGDLLLDAVKETLDQAGKPFTTEIHESGKARIPEKPVYDDTLPPMPKLHQDLRPTGLPGVVEWKKRQSEKPEKPEKPEELSKREEIDFPKTQLVNGTEVKEVNPSFKEKQSGTAADTLDLFQKDAVSLELNEKFKSFETNETINFKEGFYTSLIILGQVGGSFIVAANEEALYLIDQHAAHERLLFNKIKKSLIEKDNTIQALIVPLEVNLNYKQYNWIIENIIVLHDMGFVLEEFGENSFILREIPTWAESINAIDFLKEFADGWLDSVKKLSIDAVLERKIMSKACKKAVKANQYLTKSDIIHLFTELDQAEDAFTCPHGRPISVKFTIDEIRRKFLRT